MPPKWGELNPQTLARVIEGRLAGESGEVLIQGISTDSRSIRAGQIFWALSGERFDGHDFVLEALSKGACGAVVENAFMAAGPPPKGAFIIGVKDTLWALGQLAQWWRKEFSRLKLAAITGSSGKTTTKELTASVLGLRHHTLKTQGNFNNLIGLPLTMLDLEDRHSRAVVEIGMNRPGEIARLTEISNPDVGAITNVGKVHLEGVGDLEGVARAKLEIAHAMRQEVPLILNGDDTFLMERAAPIRRTKFSFGLGKGNWVRAEAIEDHGLKGICFKLCVDQRRADVRLKVPGIHNVYNALAASALCLILGEELRTISEGLSRFQGLKGRFQVANLRGGVTVVDDTYNSNPLSLKRALDNVKKLGFKAEKTIVVLGDMLELGNYTHQAHIEAGNWVGQMRPKLSIFIGEFATHMKDGALEEGLGEERIMVLPGHHEILNTLMEQMEEGDLIFLKASRGVGLDQVVAMLKEKVGQ